jgi:glycosyltransferase involved in cell wall biosynthesis
VKIALLAEGCYPFLTGGVSTWCDQLIRGMPEHTFDIVPIVATSGDRVVWELPPNVGELRPVALWDWTPYRRRPGPATRVAFDGLYRSFLRAMLDPAVAQAWFTESLRQMSEFAQSGNLTASLHTDDAVDALVDIWRELHPARPLSVRDAADATELIEHFLRPLSVPVVEADICHAVSNGLPALLALMAKWRFGTPLVMSEHGVYLRERYLAWQGLRYRWPVKVIMVDFFRRLCQSAYRASDLITPVNVYNQRWEMEHGADPDVISTAYNGVSAQDYPQAIGEPVIPTLGWVGRIDPLKDLETLIDAFALLHRKLPTVLLRLFGPTPVGNEWYEARLRLQAERLGLARAVSFEGPVRPVTGAYHASTVVALSSISEGLPYTVVEAMMCGRATVSTEVGGVPEVVGNAGLVVPPRDAEAFARACEQLFTNDTLRHRCARAGRVRALEFFQLDRMLGTFRHMYAELGGPGLWVNRMDLAEVEMA